MASLLIILCYVVAMSTNWLGTVSSSYYYQQPAGPTTKKKVVMNPIDACWRSDPRWSSHRKALADCSVGFGKAALGRKFGTIYTVTDPSDDPVDPKPGTLRHAAVQARPLWIVFEKDMVLRLENELLVGSFKTIDGRGARVELAFGPCITIQGASHVIVHGLRIHHCARAGAGRVRSSETHVGRRRGSDGDAVKIMASSNVWIDHCTLSSSADGLVDVTHGSTAVTISNNFFSSHDKVMLFGHKDGNTEDKKMKVTVAFNHFGPDLVQRMPRVRMGYAHVANNRYDSWEMYAIGGSSNPTILSEGNYFVAPKNPYLKEVTKREEGGWKNWKWRSTKDYFFNGAFFVPSGWGSCAPGYSILQRFPVAQGKMVPLLTAAAGVLKCSVGKPCTA